MKQWFVSCILRWGLGVITGVGLLTTAQGGLIWQSTVFDHKAQVTDSVVSAAFQFEVTGERTVTLTSIRSSCGCTTAELEKRSYEPGESGVIQAQFDLGSRVGQQEKVISVQTDDPDNPTETLRMRVYIPHVLKLEPRFVYWTKEIEPYHEQTIELISDTDLDVSIVSVEADSPQLKVRWESVGERRFRVWLQPEVPEGAEPFFRAILKITIDAPVELKQRVFHAYAFMKST